MFQNSDITLKDIEKEAQDLAFHSSGIDQCVSGNLYGPRVRRYHLIHFVLSGCGILRIDSKRLKVKAGQAFYIPAGASASYQADTQHPWKYCWIGYHGTMASYYTSHIFGDSFVTDIQDVTVYEKKIMRLLSCTDHRIQPDFQFLPETFPISWFSEAKTLHQHLRIAGLLKEFFADLILEKNSDFDNVSTASYANQIKAYIEKHYSEHIKIQDIADFLGLNPHYVTAVFKKKFGLTPKRYLTEIRVEKAKAFLADTEYPLQVIANAVGLENPFSFSRLFKSMTGVSPSEYRKNFPNRSAF
ncbi:AraC family transcriptional regulator [Sellimonas sp.]|uniref:AraC family transcriptional regulator n=1 Tax=Sellimonas sp. TaxID=2021466 RepID=UPI000B3A7B5D|nr:AraC family transcriptional regulator [Sellimonas sp.]OUP66637.1 hypothetical protein B5F13_02685 [Drancourtella sp. An177]